MQRQSNSDPSIYTIGVNLPINPQISVSFYGYSKNSIIYDSKYKSWVIIDTSASTVDFKIKSNDYKVLAVYTPTLPTSYLPTGLHYWDVRDPECNGTRKLMFTSVSSYWDLFNL